jgi:hypothetical protein
MEMRGATPVTPIATLAVNPLESATMSVQSPAPAGAIVTVAPVTLAFATLVQPVTLKGAWPPETTMF